MLLVLCVIEKSHILSKVQEKGTTMKASGQYRHWGSMWDCDPLAQGSLGLEERRARELSMEQARPTQKTLGMSVAHVLGPRTENW